MSTSTEFAGALPAKRAAHCAWLPATCRVIPHRFADLALLQLTLLANARGATCHQLWAAGELTLPVTDLLAELRAHGYRVLRSTSTTVAAPPKLSTLEQIEGSETQFALVHPSGYAEVDGRSSVQPIRVFSIDEEHVELLRGRMKTWVRPAFDQDAGVIHMLKANREGVRFAEIGTAGRALRRENYAAPVLREIDHVTKDIEAADPCGRIVLLTGPPGTGKTYLIRSILVGAKRPRFVVLQPGDLRSFLQASPLGALAEFVEDEASGRPIVLIVEDADDCLVPRGTDNMSQIAALLNLSDGLVGSAFDIRVLATTNAKVTEVDSAILRPGRLCRRIEVPRLEPAHATNVLRGLLGAEPRAVFSKPVTLAEVYAAARERPREA
ncbi:MAG: ATP-binding protein [Polyangiaceae bacterium]